MLHLCYTVYSREYIIWLIQNYLTSNCVMQIPLGKRLTETDRKPLPHSSYEPIPPQPDPDELQAPERTEKWIPIWMQSP